LLLIVTLKVSGCDRVVEGLRSHAPPQGSESAARLLAGPYRAASHDLRFVDESRSTMANADFPGAPSRTLDVTLWSPAGEAGALPLIVFSHGFTGSRSEMQFLLEHLAGHGYAVAALDFPLTNGEAPGGPNFLDLANQPGDVRFLIDSLLELRGGELPFAIDPERIGLMGLSYGGLTTTLLAFHASEVEPRARGAISIAGPSQMFTERFFAEGGPPFLMIAGTEDAFVPYLANAAPLPAKAPGSAVLALDAGTHLGFVEFAGNLLRFAHHLDGTACEGFGERIGGANGEGPGQNPFEALGSPEDGIDASEWDLPCSGSEGFPRSMRPQRQQALTSLAARAFFDSLFADDPTERQDAAAYLSTQMPDELADARYLSR
jgi:predicted dienelactone hydrolase